MDDADLSYRRPARAAGDPLDQRLDRWVSAGRQLVEGVSGARPGSRPGEPRSPARPGEPRSPARPGGRSPAFEGLGRWVEDRLDWLLEDGDDWREPWQEAPRPAAGGSPARPAAAGRDPGVGPRPRRRLEAISRRAPLPQPPLPEPALPEPALAADQEDWPDDASFSLPRWQRPGTRPQPATAPLSSGPLPSGPLPEAPAPGRPLPRSSRRR